MLAVVALTLVAVASGCGGGGGDKETVAPTTAAATTATTGGGATASGAQIFSNNCESCHGPMGTGGHVGPDLQKSPVAGHLDQVENQVRHGGGAMPPFSGVLSDKEIDAVAHYVVEVIAPKA